jgi:ATP-binding cassette subfamily B protein
VSSDTGTKPSQEDAGTDGGGRASIRRVLAIAVATVSLVWRASAALTLLLGVTTVAGAALPVGIALAGKRIVDAVLASDRDATLRWVLVELGLMVGQAVVTRGTRVLYAVIGSRLAIEVNLLIMAKALSLDLPFFEDAEFYDRLTRARRESTSRPLQLVANLFALVQSALTLAGCLTLLLGYSPWAGLVLLAATIPAAITEIRYADVTYGLRHSQSPGARRMAYVEHVLTTDEHAKEVRTFGLGPLFLGRYRAEAEGFYRDDSRLAVRHAAVAEGIATLGTAAFYGAYAFMAIAAAASRLTLGDMTMYVLAFRQGQQAFQAVLGSIGLVYEHNLYMSNLFEFLAIAPARPRLEAAPPPLLPPRATPAAGIQFVDVGFRYPTGRWALRHVDLALGPGDSLALVGENGAGKTTLVKLLLGLYQPTEGRILLDGRDLASWDPERLRARFSAVFQDYNRYQLELRDNVALGSVAHHGDEARLGRAIARSGSTDLVESLPGGLGAQLGGHFEDGAELSGGQWQRLAIARAFMREEADIVILDEPTASLDPKAERAIFERFLDLSRGRTTLVISHRFATARMARRIVVLEHGGVIENGSHAELVDAGGTYAKMFALQAEGYR